MLFITYSLLPWCHHSVPLLFFTVAGFTKSIHPRHMENTVQMRGPELGSGNRNLQKCHNMKSHGGSL